MLSRRRDFLNLALRWSGAGHGVRDQMAGHQDWRNRVTAFSKARIAKCLNQWARTKRQRCVDVSEIKTFMKDLRLAEFSRFDQKICSIVLSGNWAAFRIVL
jgi:hypothetical protein